MPPAERQVHVGEWTLESYDESDISDEDGSDDHLDGCKWRFLRRLPCSANWQYCSLLLEPDTSDNSYRWNPPDLQCRTDHVSDWKKIDWSQMREYYTENNSCKYNLGPDNELPFHSLRSRIKAQRDFINQHVKQLMKKGAKPNQALARRLLETSGFHSLEQEWSELTPQEFVRGLVALEAFKQQREYLDSLALPVDSSTLHLFQVIPKCRQKQYSGVAVRVTRTEKMWSEEGHGPDFTKDSLLNKGFLTNPPRVFYRFAYSSAGQIFSADCQSNAYIVKALLEADSESGVFLSVVGRALEDSVWSQCERLFVCARFIDVCYLAALATVGYQLRQDRTTYRPTYFILWFCCLKTLTVLILEVVMLLCQYGPRHFFDKWLTPWNVTMFPCEGFSLLSVLIILVNIAPSNDPDKEPEFLRKHPVWLSFVCGAKWFEFLMSCLCIRSLGLNVLPAVHAMFSKESLWFLVFVLACAWADFGVYYMFPIPENFRTTHHGDWEGMFEDEGWNEFVFGIMKIFRLDIMGDFDLWELEGLDKEITATAAWSQTISESDTSVAYLDEPRVRKPYARWHYGTQVFFITSCIFIHVMVLNTYIGLLTKMYEKKASRKRQLLAEFRMVHALKQLLCRLPVAWLAARLGTYRQHTKAVWISYDPELFRTEAYGLVGKGPVIEPEDIAVLPFY